MKLIFVFFLLLSCIPTIKAFDLKTAMSLVETRQLPFDPSIDEYSAGHHLDAPYKISDKLYYDFQLTKSCNAYDDIDTSMDLCLKFRIGDGMYLGLAAAGGITEYGSAALFTTDSNYNTIATLEVEVYWCYIKVKQFKITDSKEVYVYQLVPTTTKSIPLNTFRSVDAYLKCTIYRIDSAGQFIKISETRSENTRTLTRDELNDDSKNLWDWFQLKPATGVVTSVHP